MARPKEFDVDHALREAMNVFWSNGYKATSLGDLTRAMRISKSSMYETFGSKHDLFLATIEHYIRTQTTQISGAAHIDAPAVKVIRALFHRAVQRMAEPNSRRGCYLNNCAVEVSVRDGEAGERVEKGLDMMEEAFVELVARGQREGDIATHHDPRPMARFLVSSLNGILVMGKAHADTDKLNDVVDITMNALA
ncbi:MAG: TetR/AcrR family transcriptional regulator [Rhodospirillales bacterium]|nr:TetR/AcrR family transcriptional regulator [Rhodospirillales bacterium]MBO6786573.1 TetR/AcrR family transcriptional regulator [Rhodospirillales bacterium]